MNKKFFFSAAVVAFASLMLGFIIHAVLLQADYARLPRLYRSATDSQAHFGYMLLAHVLIGFGMTWIYLRGREAGKSFMQQGVRFGAAIAVVSTIPTFFIYFAVQPLPSDMVAQQIVYSTIGSLVLGIVTAWMNRT